MKCVSCGAELADNIKFCTLCGTPVAKPVPPVVEAPPVVEEPPVVEVPPVAPAPVQAAPVQPTPVVIVPDNTGLMGPWAYFGLQILFAVPVVGFIFLIIFSLNSGNLNRRNFARSYWCGLLVFLILLVIILVLLLATGAGAFLMSELGIF